MAEVADRPTGSPNQMLVLEPALRCGALNSVAVNRCHGDVANCPGRSYQFNAASHPRELRGARLLDVASKSIQRPSRANSHDQALFFAAFNLAHLAFCAAATFFLAAADSVRLLFIGTIFRAFRGFAHRAL